MFYIMTCGCSTSWISLGLKVIVGYFPDQRYHKVPFIFFLILLKYSWFTMFHFCCAIEWLSYTYPFFFIFFSSMVYHGIWNIVPWAIQRDLVVYPFYDKSLHLLTPTSQSIPSSSFHPLTTKVCFLYLWVCCFCRYVHLCHILDSTCKWYMIVFFCLTYFT